jgi:hypothetical protein
MNSGYQIGTFPYIDLIPDADSDYSECAQPLRHENRHSVFDPAMCGKAGEFLQHKLINHWDRAAESQSKFREAPANQISHLPREVQIAWSLTPRGAASL